MFKSPSVRTACLMSAMMLAAGCSSSKQAVYDHEHFDDAGTFSRSYPAPDLSSCEAGRRALLSQGYIITSSDPKMISGRKSFQQTGDTHIEISFNLVCADDATGGTSTMFANALQDRYALKKTNTSASLGVGVLGSVSMPIGSTDDSMVKVASETVASAKFYDRFFALVENFLPPDVKKAAHIVEKPKAELGEPEVAPAALAPKAPAPQAVEPAAPAPAPAAPAPAAEPAPQAQPEPQPVAPTGASEPVAAPAESGSFEVQTQEAPPEPAPSPVEPESVQSPE